MSTTEFFKIKKTNDGKRFSCFVRSYNYKDEATGMIMVFVPSLDLTAYGDTLEEANSMMRDTLEIYFQSLCALPIKSLEAELFKLGWAKKKYQTKVFTPKFDPTDALKEAGVENYNSSEFSLVA